MGGNGLHRYEGVQAKPGGFVALCACGWRSRNVRTAGTAGSVWDQHAGLVFDGKAHIWVALTRTGSSTTIALTGELDVHTAPQVHAEAVEACRSGSVVVDMAGVSFVDSSGLGTLVQLRKLCRSAGGDLELVGITARVRQTIDMAGLADFLLSA